MNEFKFNCPKCGQHILANASWIGRRIKCPSCGTRIAVPAPAKAQQPSVPVVVPVVAKPKTPPVKPDKNPIASKKETKKNGPMVVTSSDAKAESSGKPLRVDVPGKTDKTGSPTAKEPKKNTPAVVIPSVAKPNLPGFSLREDAPAETDTPDPAPMTTPQPAEKVADTDKAAPAPPETKPPVVADAPTPPAQPRVAVLSPAVKLDLVRAVRRRIADESAWLPGKVEGTTAYAAKMQDGKEVLLDAKSTEATRFSLMGAFLLEMHVRQVVATATGRKRFLDDEIPDAIREVLMEQLDDEEREHAEDPLANKDVLAISHAQCWEVLDALDELYSQWM
ncbi:MAG: hypothetical protein MUF81_07865 [Verrucomicrobia bacterium]|nr:hypothetical protein [Verrucomicrobiota bacterium]